MTSRNVETLRQQYQDFNAKNFDQAMKLVAPKTKVVDLSRYLSINYS